MTAGVGVAVGVAAGGGVAVGVAVNGGVPVAGGEDGAAVGPMDGAMDTAGLLAGAAVGDTVGGVVVAAGVAGSETQPATRTARTATTGAGLRVCIAQAPAPIMGAATGNVQRSEGATKMERAVPVLAGLLAVGATIAAGFIYAMSILIAPMPWPWLFAAVWLGFVFVAVIGALRSPYRTLLVPVIAAATGAGWLLVGQQFFGWGP